MCKQICAIVMLILVSNNVSESRPSSSSFSIKDSLSNGDSIKYISAFEFIKNSPDIREKFPIYMDSAGNFTVSVSREILNHKPIFFGDEIVNYEYDTLSKEEKTKLKDEIFFNVGDGLKISYGESSLFNNNAPNENSDLLIFFSIPEGDRLLADVYPYKGYADYKNASVVGMSSLSYLFYFEGDKIVKAFVLEMSG